MCVVCDERREREGGGRENESHSYLFELSLPIYVSLIYLSCWSRESLPVCVCVCLENGMVGWVRVYKRIRGCCRCSRFGSDLVSVSESKREKRQQEQEGCTVHVCEFCFLCVSLCVSVCLCLSHPQVVQSFREK